MIIDNKLYHYPVAVYKKNDGSGLMALIPDLPQYYKIERMASVDDALLHAALTIYGYITDTLIEGKTPAEPTPLDKLIAFPEAYVRDVIISIDSDTDTADPDGAPYVYDIDWDTDDDREAAETLPLVVFLPAGMDDEDDISDYLSDLTGFCHTGFRVSVEDDS